MATATAPPTICRGSTAISADSLREVLQLHGRIPARKAALRLDTDYGAHELDRAGRCRFEQLYSRTSRATTGSSRAAAQLDEAATDTGELSSCEVVRRRREYKPHWAYAARRALESRGEEHLLAAVMISIRFCWPIQSDMASAPPPRQIASRSSDGCTSISSACRRLPRRSTSFSRMADQMPTSNSSIGCSRRRRSASGWPLVVRPGAIRRYGRLSRRSGSSHHPYRDYVIKTLNGDLPFDQFTVEQLAGDLLPNPTMWHRGDRLQPHPADHARRRRGADDEYRGDYVADRVRNFSETWMAGSMGCAQCHDHKYDPYSQEDFFSVQAFFADVDEYGSFQPVGGDDFRPSGRPRCSPGRCRCPAVQKVDEKIANRSPLTGLMKGLAGAAHDGEAQEKARRA